MGAKSTVEVSTVGRRAVRSSGIAKRESRGGYCYVKMEPIPVDELGSAGGIWVVDILDSRRGDGGRRWLRGRAGTGAADGTSAVVAGLSSGQAQLVSYNVV